MRTKFVIRPNERICLDLKLLKDFGLANIKIPNIKCKCNWQFELKLEQTVGKKNYIRAPVKGSFFIVDVCIFPFHITRYTSQYINDSANFVMIQSTYICFIWHLKL